MTTIYVKDKTKLPERREYDFYATERTLIREALNSFAPSYPRTVLDLGAGDGRWGQIAGENGVKDKIVGVELRDVPEPEHFTNWIIGDLFESQTLAEIKDASETYDLVLSNPPYKFAEGFVRIGWDFLAKNGVMIMLLPLSFMATVTRYEGLWSEIWPKHIAVCARRPSFYGGGTNGTDYGIYVWEKYPLHPVYPSGSPRSWTTSLLLHERDKDNL